MSVALFVLFIIALLVTLAGLFLSPRLQPRREQNDYLVTPSGRRIVDSTPASRRSRYTAAASISPPAPARRRASMLVGEIYTEPVITRRTRAVVPHTQKEFVATARRMKTGTRTGSTSIAYPGPLEALKDQLGSWKAALPLMIMIFLLIFYLINAFLPHPLLWTPVSFNPANPPGTPISAKTPVYAASLHLMRLGQLDPAQYQSMQEYNLWAYSACSAASMTEVINAYGHNYRITTILEVEASIHEITPQDGLLEESGIEHTGAQFGFKTTWGHHLSLNQVIAAANSGTPVIVSFPPSRFAGGHILVVRGGDSNYVYLADSSRLNWTQLSRARFMQFWGGFSAIMTPA